MQDQQQPALKTPLAIVYIVIVAALCLVPSVGLLFGGLEESSDSDAAPEPRMTNDDGSVNFNVLADAGDWFDDHFAFRNEWVTAAAFVEGGLFGVSSNDGVVYGTDGWLYYGDSVDDFRGTDQLNDRQLYDIAHSAALVQKHALSRGIDFAFMISPNKNTLYGQNMPYYYQVDVGDSNLERIAPMLQAEGVNYVDARKLIREATAHLLSEGSVDGSWNQASTDNTGISDGEVLYHKRDSHWNNKGAALVADALMTSLGHAHRDYATETYSVRDDFSGDLDKMLFPSAPTPEAEVYYDTQQQFEYVTENVQSNFDPKIQTASTAVGATGSLVMYRDSFCNSLLPFMAEAYDQAYFSRAVPYQLSIDLAAHDADALIIERAQRFMRDMAANAPVMPAPMLLEGDAPTSGYRELQDVNERVQGEYLLVTGDIPDAVEAGDRIAIRLNGTLVYEAFGMSDSETSQEGFQLLVPTSIALESGNTYELCLFK